jgi:hypothetical protein
VIERARKERTPIFIGVTLEKGELPLVTERVGTACREAAAFVVGRRQRKARHRR